MSRVFTMAALQSRSDTELHMLMRQTQAELVRSRSGSPERRAALANLENICRALSLRI